MSLDPGTPPHPSPLFQFFSYAHLPPHLRKVSEPFHALASSLQQLPANSEREAAMRKLLEAKDCAVRPALLKEA